MFTYLYLVQVELEHSKETTANKTVYRLHVTFVDKEGDKHTFEVAEGDNLLDIAQANDLEMEGQLTTSMYVP